MSDRQDFLIVEIGQAAYALPAFAVDAAVAPGLVTPLPFVPPHVEGLVNVNERVLPLINLRRLLAVSGDNHAGNTSELVIVETPRAPCALRVDRVLGRVEPDTLHSLRADADDTGMAQDGLIVARFEWQQRTVLVCGLEALGRQVAAQEQPAGRRGLLGRLQQEEDTGGQASLLCLALRAAGERYVLPLATAVEILDLETATPIPGAPELIEGIAVVRHEALLVLSLARLLRRPEKSYSRQQQVVVIDRSGTHYGLRVDGVDGIVACKPEEVRRVEDESGEVSGVVIHDEQVLGLLEATRLLSAERHALLLPFVPAQRRHDDRQQEIFQPVLEVALGTESFGIPLPMVRRIVGHALREHLHANNDVLVSGAVNIDGQVIPVVDFTRLLQLTDNPADGAQEVWILVGDGEREWAIPVREARRIVEVPATAIEDMGRTRDGLVSGIANIDNRLVPLLSTRVLLEAT